jgi:hypothetical protein
MTKDMYRYAFREEVPIEEVEASLLLAVLAAESLYGEAQTRLDAAHYLDPAKRACVIDAGTPVGRDLNRFFTGFLIREFGADSFRVERVDGGVNRAREGVAA